MEAKRDSLEIRWSVLRSLLRARLCRTSRRLVARLDRATRLAAVQRVSPAVWDLRTAEASSTTSTGAGAPTAFAFIVRRAFSGGYEANAEFRRGSRSKPRGRNARPVLRSQDHVDTLLTSRQVDRCTGDPHRHVPGGPPGRAHPVVHLPSVGGGGASPGSGFAHPPRGRDGWGARRLPRGVS